MVDGFPRSQHALELAKSDEPLEDGTKITDHAATLPEKIKLTGLVSDWYGGSRPGFAWQEIRRLNQVKEPLTVVTEWGIYRNMLMEKVTADELGRGMEFVMDLEEVKRVGNPESSLPEGTTTGPAADRTGELKRGRVALGPIIDLL